MGDPTTTILTFGQRGSHFVACPSYQNYTRLPPGLTTLLTTRQIATIHHVTLGFEDSFLLTYCDTSGRDHIESNNLPDPLHPFLHSHRHIPSLRLTLGPYNSSFFAHDSSSYLWLNLPSRLLSSLHARIANGEFTDKPKLVALGADSAFVLVTERGDVVWELKAYRALEEVLKAVIGAIDEEESGKGKLRKGNGIEEVVLHAYRYGCYTAVTCDNTEEQDSREKTRLVLKHANIPPHQLSAVEALRAPLASVIRPTFAAPQEKKKLPSSRNNVARTEPQRPRPVPLQHQSQQSSSASASSTTLLQRSWGDAERKHEFRAQTRGMKLSLSLSVRGFGMGLGIGGGSGRGRRG